MIETGSNSLSDVLKRGQCHVDSIRQAGAPDALPTRTSKVKPGAIVIFSSSAMQVISDANPFRADWWCGRAAAGDAGLFGEPREPQAL
jgi:hypothetical protein